MKPVWTYLKQNQEKCSKQAVCGTSFVILHTSNQGEEGKKCSKQAVCGTSFVILRVSNQGEEGEKCSKQALYGTFHNALWHIPEVFETKGSQNMVWHSASRGKRQ